ncbi:MAG: NAAT family transporter [Flavobacteriales bacterium]|nr:NAAT family transporter [Flavobacteriales bacterium]
MSQEWSFFLVVFTSFFTVINPLGVLPIFLTMTDGLDNVARRNTAQKAMIVSFITMVLFSLSGQVLFEFFGISVHSFRIVGGIIFFMVGQDMLQARLQRTKVPSKKVKEYVGDISITPLAVPMITGPGAITNAIVLKEQADSYLDIIAFYGGIFVVCVITLMLLISANQILRVLGDTGAKMLMRIMGLIVMVIAVEFFLSGLRPIIKETLIDLQS